MSLFIFVLVFLVMNDILFTSSINSCGSHKDCLPNNVCCRSVLSTEFSCRIPFKGTTQSCFGYYCTHTSDCRGPKDGQKVCCRSNKCAFCPQCLEHFDCGQSRYCCRNERDEQRHCSYSCVGEVCQKNSHCGVHECCRSQRCVQCSTRGCATHSQCPTGQYCCFKPNQLRNKCASKCDEESCILSSDCAVPGAWCVAGTCSRTKECNVTSDCVTSERGQYHCCMDENVGIKVCKKTCNSDSDCFDTQCCSSDRTCVTRSTCSWKFPYWLIGVLVALVVVIVVIIFGCYSFKKLRPHLNMRQPDENATQNNVFSGNERERAQNVYHDPPTREMPVYPTSHLLVSRPEAQEQIYYPLATGNNEFIQMLRLPSAPQLEDDVNRGDEPCPPPPLYVPNGPLASSGDTAQENYNNMPLVDNHRISTQYDNVALPRL